uniref:MYND-type domain-containing protein n=1 Tax=Bactrocera latifrons TaxID=174628 RepID=A0A0K8VNN1_BACLA
MQKFDILTVMDGKPKKTRQRNRPRNKANRLKEDIGQTSNSELNNTESVALNIVGQQKTFGSEFSTQTSKDSDNGLRLLQQMMRTKLLQQGKKSEKGNVNTKASEKVDKKDQKSSGSLSKGKESGKTTNGKAAAANKSPPDNNLQKQSAFVASLQRKLESSVANGSTDLPNTLLENLQKLLHEGPISDVESSDDEDNYIEYIYRPRQYFLVALCNLCKDELTAETKTVCKRCQLAYYCSIQHMKGDEQHRQICYALQQVADNCGKKELFHMHPTQIHSDTTCIQTNFPEICNKTHKYHLTIPTLLYHLLYNSTCHNIPLYNI